MPCAPCSLVETSACGPHNRLLRLSFDGQTDTVRAALTGPIAKALADLPEPVRISAQIVLAETLNNIVEHAYAGTGGAIRVCLHTSARDLVCCFCDDGCPMPENALPAGKPRPPSSLADLPEGGHGWFLIRTLARGLAYKRIGDENRLCFTIPLTDTPLGNRPV